jgi:hypothetical protein
MLSMKSPKNVKTLSSKTVERLLEPEIRSGRLKLDGTYILRGAFRDEWESDKVKWYGRIFDDLSKIFRKIHTKP